jgi:uncharacterized protein (DUF58 family)
MHGRIAVPRTAKPAAAPAWPRRAAPPKGTDAPRARIHLTGAGGWGILTSLAIASAAANTANNLLYLLLALLLASYAVSVWLSRRTVASLAGQIVAPSEVIAGSPADVVVIAGSRGRRAPGVVLELRAVDSAGWEWAPPSIRSLPLVEADRTSSASLRIVVGRRGPARLRLVGRSPFPFGLIEGLRRLAEEEILVLPVPDASWRRALDEARSDGAPAPRKGEGTDIFNIRDYQWGEDARRMDWKATARLGRPMLREHAREHQRSAVLLIPSLPGPAGSAPPGPDDPAERLISRAAGAAIELEREGWRLRLLAPGADVRGDARALLRALARLKAVPAPHGWWRGHLAPGETVLDLASGAREPEEIPA